MDDVYCTGTESTLISCRHTTNHNCGHYEDAGVRCTSTSTCKYKALCIVHVYLCICAVIIVWTMIGHYTTQCTAVLTSLECQNVVHLYHATDSFRITLFSHLKCIILVSFQ